MQKRFIRSSLIGVTLLATPMMATAVAPGGPNCGWGNMLFEGSSGLGPHLGASLVNGSTYNSLVGMTLGTNGCSVEGKLTYGGQNLLKSAAFMDDVAHDIAKGEGEALDALMVLIGVETVDRPLFRQVAKANFDKLFPSADVTAEEMLRTLGEVLKSDETLAQYAA